MSQESRYELAVSSAQSRKTEIKALAGIVVSYDAVRLLPSSLVCRIVSGGCRTEVHILFLIIS